MSIEPTNKPTFTVGNIEDKVYEFLNSFSKFKDNKKKQDEIFFEHREILEEFAKVSLELEPFKDDLPKPNDNEKMDRFHELDIKHSELLSTICVTLNVDFPLDLDYDAFFEEFIKKQNS